MANIGILTTTSMFLTLGLAGCANMSDYSAKTDSPSVAIDGASSGAIVKAKPEEEKTRSELEYSSDMSGQQEEQEFSFLNPASFHLASESQRKILKDIYESEFDLSHLSEEEQKFLTEALSKSGIEVQSACVIRKETTAKVGAFFRKWNMIQTTKYFPPSHERPFTHWVEQTDLSNESKPKTTRNAIHGDTSDYPYPLSEANAVIKLVPINLSSTRALDRTDASVTYKALPSKLLFANLSSEDQLWSVEDGHVIFKIDLQTKRLDWLTYELREPVKVHNFVKISGFQLNYQFEDDEDLGRNVIRSVEHSMKGRLALLFRPNLQVSNSFIYESCSISPPTDSYLFRSMSAIASL